MSKNASLGARLKTVREAAGMSQRQLTIKLGYHPENSGSISGFESGKKGLSESKVAKLIEIFPELGKKIESKEKNSTPKQFGIALKAALDSSNMGQGQASLVVGYKSPSGINKILKGTSVPSEEAYDRMVAVFPSLKEIPPPIFTHVVGRGSTKKGKVIKLPVKKAKESAPVTKVKRVLGGLAARNAGEVGKAPVGPTGERKVPWSYARALIGLVKDTELKDSFIMYLKAAAGHGMSVSHMLNDLESI